MMETLEQKTQRYWRLSCTRNSRPGMMCLITIEEALNILGDVLRWTSPYRPLARLVSDLQHTIVMGEKPRSRSA